MFRSTVAIGVCVLALPTSTLTALQIRQRDSAGVTIVESASPRWTGGDAWKVDPQPRLTIGTATGADAYLFSNIVGAVRVSGGDIIVADGATRQLRRFGDDGVVRKAVGGPGSGPGEFQVLGSLSRCGGYLVTEDLLSVSFWTEELDFVGRPNLRRFPVTPVVCLTGRAVLLRARVGPPLQQLATANAGIVQDSASLWLSDSSGIPLHSIGTLPSAQTFFYTGGSVAHPFLSRTLITSHNDRFFLSTGQSFDVSVYRGDGVLDRILRVSYGRQRLTQTDVQEYRAASLSVARSEGRRILEGLGMPMPTHLPAVSQLAVDSDGCVWLKHFTPFFATGNTWSVFSSSGELLGSLSLPLTLEVLDIGSDYVLGVQRDADGVEYVVLHTLDRR